MTLSGPENGSVANVFPVVMQSSDLVLQDEEGNSVVTELEELSSASDQTFGSSAINIENSTDVIIGPVTQFHGPVTIYQNVNGTPALCGAEKRDVNHYQQNGKLTKSDSTSSDVSHTAEKSNKTTLPFSKYLKFVGIPLIVLFLIATITTAIILAYRNVHASPRNNTDDNSQPNATHKIPDVTTQMPLGPGIIMGKKEWGGEPAISSVPLKHPTPLVIISHTATPFCKTNAACSERVLSIQQYHVGTINSPDIGYNFLIGGDGNVYEGRGWDKKNFHMPDSLGISFIGNYIYDHLTSDMVKVTQQLLADGIINGKLSENYELVGHNQTFATISPGPNAYAVISKWPHYSSRIIRPSE